MNKKVYVMFCYDDDGEYELWLNETNEVIGGYFTDDANWRHEYFNGIFEKLGINIIKLPYDEELANTKYKELWG